MHVITIQSFSWVCHLARGGCYWLPLPLWQQANSLCAVPACLIWQVLSSMLDCYCAAGGKSVALQVLLVQLVHPCWLVPCSFSSC